jgi:protein-tyrosine phosphatase
MNPELFWIPGPWRGKLAIVTRPRGGDWLEDEAAGWRKAGLAVVVSLLESNEAAGLGLAREGEVAKSNGVHFISFPIPDRGVPSSMGDALPHLSTIAVELENGKTVAVHCRQGVGRSGLIAAALLVTSGMSAAKAIETVSAARGQTVPETPAQVEWIEHLPSERLVPTR